MFEHNAIETVGKQTLLIKDNKIIGEVSVVTMVGMVCGVSMKDTACKELIKDTAQFKIWSGAENGKLQEHGYKYSYFHFNIITGEYIGDYITQNQFREKEEALEGCFVVDKFNFEYGWCSRAFADVEGFGQRMEQ
jgi:hypothetical protein